MAPPVPTGAGAVPLHAARTLADRLLPPGFGRDGRTGQTSSSGGHEPPPPGPRGTTPSLQVRGIRHGPGTVSVDWRVSWRGQPSSCVLRVGVASEGRPFTRERWQNEAAGPFPLTIVDAAADDFAKGAAKGNGPVVRTLLHGDELLVEPGRAASKKPFSLDGSMTIRVTPPENATIQPVLALAVPGAANETVS